MASKRSEYIALIPHCQNKKQEAIVEGFGRGLTAPEISAELGMTERNVFANLAKVRAFSERQRSHEVVIDKPVEELDIDSLIEQRKRQFERKSVAEQSRSLLHARVKIKGPIGILFFGDPHVDDDGTDIGLLFEHARLVRNTEGLFGANVGDSTNNWVGRLGRLYAQQGTTAAEAWAICEHFIREVRDWLFILSGNHDAWSGAGDPLQWICRQGGNLYETNVRMQVDFPGGQHITINARHDFSGHSMWNPAHGVGRAVQQGMWDEIAVAGHRHVSGYMILKSPVDGKICHALQVASYKIYDRYAKEKGFRDQNVSPAALALIDPSRPHTSPGRVRIEHDIEAGVDLLKWLRSRK